MISKVLSNKMSARGGCDANSFDQTTVRQVKRQAMSRSGNKQKRNNLRYQVVDIELESLYYGML